MNGQFAHTLLTVELELAATSGLKAAAVQTGRRGMPRLLLKPLSQVSIGTRSGSPFAIARR
jgi:hypothetical protein